MASKNKHSKRDKVITLFVLLLVGGFLLWCPIVFLRAEITGFIYLNNSSEWKPTNARIEASSISKKKGNHPSGRYTTFTKVNFMYRYKVDGELYSGKRYAFGFKNYDREAISNYNVRDSIQIYHHPEDPSISTVKKEYEFGFWTPFLYLVVLATIVLSGFILLGAVYGTYEMLTGRG